MALADVDLRRLINARAARPGSPCRAEPLPRDISAAAEAVGVPYYWQALLPLSCLYYQSVKFVGKRNSLKAMSLGRAIW